MEMSGQRRSWKLIASSGIILAVLLVIMGLLLTQYHASMMEDRQNRVREMVDRAHYLVKFYYSKIEKEGLPEASAKEYALQAIRDLPYDNNGYCWINDMNGIMIMHPIIPKLDGTNVYDYKDPNGKYLFRDFITTVREHGAGFVDYMWPKPHEPKDKSFPKLSYVIGFEPWGWIIGSGIYIDDVDSAFRQAILITGGLVLVVLLFTIALFFTFSESFRKV